MSISNQIEKILPVKAFHSIIKATGEALPFGRSEAAAQIIFFTQPLTGE